MGPAIAAISAPTNSATIPAELNRHRSAVQGIAYGAGALLAACASSAMVAPALAQKSQDTLRITWRDAIPDVDPYYNSLRTGMVLAFLVYDG